VKNAALTESGKWIDRNIHQGSVSWQPPPSWQSAWQLDGNWQLAGLEAGLGNRILR